MATTQLHLNPGGVPHLTLLAALTVALAAVLTGSTTGASSRPATNDSAEIAEDEELEGYVATGRHQPPGAIEIAFPRESYAPGERAALRFWTPVRRVTVQVFRVGAEHARTIGNETMQGDAVTTPRRAAETRNGTRIAIAIGDWPSGFYFARATAPGGRMGFAPFVVRPRSLGEHRVAVVLPTRTWQAYNFRDDDGDGQGDTWYANQRHTTARLGRPFLNRGVPPHFRNYDLKFLHWLHDTERQVDLLSQAELDRATGARLASAYDLIVFPGHHEYVTRAEYDAVRGFRDRGGSLAFLSANNFYWRIDLHGDAITRVDQWRDLGRPEASLLGAQYIGNDMGEHRGPWLVRGASARSWLFDGVKLTHGDEFSDAGIEIDATAASSPRGTQVVAEIPNLLGPGLTAQMTYYETPRGARVFAAGAFTLAGSVRQPVVRRLLDNLWRRLTDERAPQVGGH